jgi:short-subunit dehydrogenase
MTRLLISGVTSGLGKHLLSKAITSGWDVTTIVRSSEKSVEGCENLIADLSNSKDLDTLTASLKDRTFDHVVLNAACAKVGPFHLQTATDIDTVLRTNLHAPLRMVHALIPNNPRTKFTFMSSLSVHYPGTNYATYSVSKAAITQLYHALQIEYPLLPLLCLEFGGMKTGMHEKVGMKVNTTRFRDPKKVATKVFSAIQKKTGLRTLHTDWYVVRKIGVIMDGTKTRIRRWHGARSYNWRK